MNKQQRLAVLCTIVVIVFMTLFPPWEGKKGFYTPYTGQNTILTAPGWDSGVTVKISFRFLFSPPSEIIDDGESFVGKLRLDLLVVEILATCLVGAGFVLFFKRQ